MRLRMKNFNILRVQWKIKFLERVHEKPIYKGDCLKKKKGGGGGGGQFPDLREELEKRWGWCFWVGGLIPQCTLWS